MTIFDKNESISICKHGHLHGHCMKRISLLFSSVGKVQNSCDPGFFLWRESASEIAREPDL